MFSPLIQTTLHKTQFGNEQFIDKHRYCVVAQ